MDVMLLIILFIWFTFIMTGLRIGKYLLCSSSIRNKEKPEIIMWVILFILLPMYVFLGTIGKIAMLVYLLLWFIAQWYFTIRFIFFPNTNKVKGYNKYFEDTHHIIKPSEKRLIPDTYHIILFITIFLCIILIIMNL